MISEKLQHKSCKKLKNKKILKAHLSKASQLTPLSRNEK
jgi:hypothetical protein